MWMFHRYKALDIGHIIPPPARQSSALQILTFFIIGCATAAAHHFYYWYLNNKSVDGTFTTPLSQFSDQKWASHMGTALSFATKFFFAKAVGAAYVQRLWTATRRTGGMSLDGLDAGFDILTNLQSFLCWDLISSAQFLILLALISWTIPLIAIVAPGALVIASHETKMDMPACVIPSIDLAMGASSAALTLYASNSGLLCYSSPSSEMKQLATLALLSGTYAVPHSPCGSVCSYSTSFFAPYFSCSEPYDIGTPRTPAGGMYFWNATSLVNQSITPDQLSIEWYGDRQADIIGRPPNPTDDQAQRVICTAVNASYVLNVQHNGSSTTITPLFLTPMNNFSSTDARNRPIDPENTEATVYTAILQAVYDILTGTVTVNETMGYPTSPPPHVSRSSDTSPTRRQVTDSQEWSFDLRISNTMVTMGRNFGEMNKTASEWIPSSNVGQHVESLMRNISIGLMALNISESSSQHTPISDLSSGSEMTCMQTLTENVYVYHQMVLLVPYIVALVCTLFSVLVGLHALRSNPSKGNTGFKTMLAVTRNQDLDLITIVGGEKVDEKARLRFVDFESDGNTPRRVFELVPVVTADKER